MSKKTAAPLIVDSIRHQDKRANIPTEELRDFVADEELAPQTITYPRDTSLDPQLVWKGKDQQDREELAVPVVPIYIQEKIHPQALIDALPRIEKAGGNQLNLFADFNGIEGGFDRKVDFYSHNTGSQPNWSNRLILGDSLLVMASLAEKEGLKGKVQTIYLDPPYGIKFGSNWQVSTRKRDVKDGKAEDATRQPEQVRAFRDTWKLGIHSYLSYLRDRLVVARELLTETGSVFVQIGDENVHLVRCVLDEVFGSENFCAQITFKKTGYATSELIPSTTDIDLWYAKDRTKVKYRQLYTTKSVGIGIGDRYNQLELPDGASRPLSVEEFDRPNLIPQNCRIWAPSPLTSSGFRVNTSVPYSFEGKMFDTGLSQNWKTTLDGLEKLNLAGRIVASRNTLNFKRYLEDFPAISLTTTWDDTMAAADGGKFYVVQTATRVVERCLLMTTDPGDLVLDPTCGSGTTAYVAEQWGRRWITCDTSRVALALARTRLMAAKYPYYLLADSDEGIKKESELTGKLPPDYMTEGDIKKGFVYKRVPHVTLKSIANNPEIKEGMTRQQIDATIARHADTETLYDQPYPDNKRIRVCGPFSVESLSPHRVLSTADGMDGTATEQEARNQQDFTSMILDNLKKAGVQNTVKGERLSFDRLDPYAGTWLHASGEYTDADDKTRRVAISIGPEHGTVGPQQVKEAARKQCKGWALTCSLSAVSPSTPTLPKR